MCADGAERKTLRYEVAMLFAVNLSKLSSYISCQMFGVLATIWQASQQHVASLAMIDRSRQNCQLKSRQVQQSIDYSIFVCAWSTVMIHGLWNMIAMWVFVCVCVCVSLTVNWWRHRTIDATKMPSARHSVMIAMMLVRPICATLSLSLSRSKEPSVCQWGQWLAMVRTQ